MHSISAKSIGNSRDKSGPALGVSADSASEIVKFTISIPRESCTNAKAKYISSVVPPDPSVHFLPLGNSNDYGQLKSINDSNN